MPKEPNQLDIQKLQLIEDAELKFGKMYFDRLEELSQDLLLVDDETNAGFSITVNYQGAFYASPE